MKWVRNLYDWVLSWADSKYGGTALFILAFVESVFFPIPPDILLIALCLGGIAKSFRYALICSVASISGAFVGYAVGYFAWMTSSGDFTAFANFFFNNIPGFTV